MSDAPTQTHQAADLGPEGSQPLPPAEEFAPADLPDEPGDAALPPPVDDPGDPAALPPADPLARPPAAPPQLRPVELAEAFAEAFASAAAPLAHAPVRVRFAGLSQLSWPEFVGSVRESSCCFAVWLAAELTGSAPTAAWIDLAPPAAFALVEAMLGSASRSAYVPARALTDLERALLGRIVKAVAPTPSPDTDWPPAPRQEAVLAASYDLAVGPQVASLRLCVPVEPSQAHALTRPLGKPCQPLEISVTTEYSQISQSDLDELAPGDILISQTDVEADVIVRAAGIPKFAARLGACDGQRAVTIRRPVAPPGPPPADSPA